jgi:Flp pilus assembly protein TadD
MKKNRPLTPRLSEEIEERLHPSKFLGYDRDKMGLFLISKGIFDLAETQFLRAAYLNPYEPAFMQHLAWALFKQNKLGEAHKAIDASLEKRPDDNDSIYIRQRIENAEHESETGND